MSEAEFVFPVRTKAISLTGRACSLNCAHCNRHYLGNMGTLGDMEQDKPFSSILASGGCDKEGRVPLLEFRDELSKLREKYKIVAHTGLFPPGKVKELRGIADVVSFDLPPSTNAIREVFGIDKTRQDYVDSLCALMKEVPTVPHLTIGLRGGKIEGERDSLDIIAGLGQKKIVLNVLVPTPGTRYQDRAPPSVGDVVSLLNYSKRKFDKVYLGCVRPGGNYRERLDKKALGIVDRIVMPARGISREKAEVFHECCAF